MFIWGLTILRFQLFIDFMFHLFVYEKIQNDNISYQKSILIFNACNKINNLVCMYATLLLKNVVVTCS